MTKFVEKLSASTGGTSYIIDDDSDVAAIGTALRQLIYELRSQYVIGYIPTKISKTNNKRRLKVQIKDGPNGEKRNATIKDTIVLNASK